MALIRCTLAVMRVLVVAGTGFIGGHAAQAFLAAGHRVRALVRATTRSKQDARLRGAELVEGSLGAIPAEVLDGPHDAVVYAAGVWRRDLTAPDDEVRRRCDEVYLRGVEVLAERALAWNAHFIFVSGVSRYGELSWEGALGEGAAPAKLSVYGAYKRQSEALLERAAARGLRYTALVPPEVYGAHDPGGYVRFVYDRVRGRRFVVLGDGDNRWSLCNVRNVADAALHFAERDGAGPVHIADALPTSQRELAEALSRALWRTPLFPAVPRGIALAVARVNAALPRPASAPRPFAPAHVSVRTAERVLDTSRAHSHGFTPRFDLKDGIARAVDWWQRDVS
ncbi:MAG TPA: NAD(P)-dependent oxidoreductase [Polyangiaceae bacterium]|jgi:UDP-glucose 4-epimerase|nr:NAD(P)-dependent oxidoreductase [Polyangiaceae bacterium]